MIAKIFLADGALLKISEGDLPHILLNVPAGGSYEIVPDDYLNFPATADRPAPEVISVLAPPEPSQPPPDAFSGLGAPPGDLDP